MLAAGDTFRAAAIEQLKIWGERTGSPVVAAQARAPTPPGSPTTRSSSAKADGADVLIIDTAGRLQNKAELMAELEKIVRVLGKLDPEAPHTVLQTVDATTGQNALNQVEIFRNVAGVNGLVMTKLDGTARGGILVAIAAKHKLPVYFIGVGEQVDDLEPFSAGDFARRHRRSCLEHVPSAGDPSFRTNETTMIDPFSNATRPTRDRRRLNPLLKLVLELGPLLVFFFANARGEWLVEQFPALAEFGGPIFVATGAVHGSRPRSRSSRPGC